jgi:putative transposase
METNLRILEIKEIKSIPYTPRSHPFVERVIRIIRNEFLFELLFFNSQDLEIKPEKFRQYFNNFRAHSSINAMTPSQKANERNISTTAINSCTWKSHYNGLFSLPTAV